MVKICTFIAHLLYYVFLKEFQNFPLGKEGIAYVKTTEFPLDGTVYIESIAQPIIRGSPVNRRKILNSSEDLRGWGLTLSEEYNHSLKNIQIIFSTDIKIVICKEDFHLFFFF